MLLIDFILETQGSSA